MSESATWTRILAEITKIEFQDQRTPPVAGQPSASDVYRRQKIAAVEKVTGRPLIIYASACISPGKRIPGDLLMIDFSDKIGFQTVTQGIDGPNLDVLMHSPGGIADAAESIVGQLRSKFSNIRFIVPSFAKSAATMMVMSGNQILMDPQAELGPIDPQFRTQNGTSPAVAVLEQFKRAQEEIRNDPGKLSSWMPILAPLGPSLLVDCQHAIDLAKALVRTWVQTYMLTGDPDAATKADAICNFLSDHKHFKSHARAVKIPDLLPLGVKVIDLTTLPEANAIDELYCCLDILLANTPVYKLFENSSGDALIRSQQQILPPQLMVQPPPPIPGKATPSKGIRPPGIRHHR